MCHDLGSCRSRRPRICCCWCRICTKLITDHWLWVHVVCFQQLLWSSWEQAMTMYTISRLFFIFTRLCFLGCQLSDPVCWCSWYFGVGSLIDRFRRCLVWKKCYPQGICIPLVWFACNVVHTLYKVFMLIKLLEKLLFSYSY